MKRGLKGQQITGYCLMTQLRLNEKRIERQIEFTSVYWHPQCASMKRGLKEQSENGTALATEIGLNEKRIESVWGSSKNLKPMILPQWKEDWKLALKTSGRGSRRPLPQWKEDWKISLLSSSSFSSAYASMKRGLKDYVAEHDWELPWPASMKRGLKEIVSSCSSNILPPASMKRGLKVLESSSPSFSRSF